MIFAYAVGKYSPPASGATLWASGGRKVKVLVGGSVVNAAEGTLTKVE